MAWSVVTALVLVVAFAGGGGEVVEALDLGGAINGHDADPERHQRYRDDLEVGDRERDADDRQAEQDARDQMSERELPAEEDYL